jgi:hypothetical protein
MLIKHVSGQDIYFDFDSYKIVGDHVVFEKQNGDIKKSISIVIKDIEYAVDKNGNKCHFQS